MPVEHTRIGLAFVTACCVATQVLIAAQDSRTTPAFSVSGIVLDPSGAAASGALVMLHDNPRGIERSSQADEAGSFRFDDVSPGPYEIEVHHEGFKLHKTHLKVGTRNPAPLRISLELSELHEEITVGSAEERVNTEIGGNLDSVKLDRRMLDDLPILGNDIVGTISRLLTSASLGSNGPSVVVDGMETSSIGVPASAIEEVRINQNPYSAEFSRPGSGRLEIRTKAGSPKYHASLSFGMRDYRLDARNAFAVERPQEQRRLFDGYFSGPLGGSKKKTFLLSASHEERDSQQIVYALTPNGLVRNNFPNPQRSTLLSARLDDHLSKKEIFSIRYTFYNWSDRGEGVGGFKLPDVASDSTSRKHESYLAYKAVLTSNLVNELSVRGGRNESASLSRLPGVPKIVVLDAFTAGGGQNDGRQTESFVQLTDILSWSHGKHFVKAGINIPDLSRRYLGDRTNFDGTFEFSSLADYSLRRPFSFTRQQGNGNLRLWNEELGTFIQDDIRIRPDFSMGLGLRYDWQSHLNDYNNFAPRLSFAYAPGKSRKTVFRGGAGIFYDRTGVGPIEDVLRYDGGRLQQTVISDPSYPDPFSTTSILVSQPATIVRFAPNLRSPYIAQYSFGVETQLAKSTTLTATYLGTRGIKLFRSRDVNAPLPPLFLNRPDLSIGMFRQIESSGHLEGHSLRVALQGNLTRFFNGLVQYTLGRTYNDTNGIGSFPANQYDLTGEWSRASSDTRHGLYAYGTLTAKNYFKLGVIFWAYSGTPYSLITGRDDDHDTLANDRPPGVRRNSLEGPGMKTLDLRWSKQFYLRPSKKDKGPSATLGADAFNVANWVSFTSMVGNLSSPFFGRPVAALAARRLQLSLRLDF